MKRITRSTSPGFSEELSEELSARYYLLRELWLIIFRFLPFPALIRLGAVSKYWRELTTLSVTSFDGYERVGNWLNDDVLKRFVSLESLCMTKFDSDGTLYFVCEPCILTPLPSNCTMPVLLD
jgi:hypothetical protein